MPITPDPDDVYDDPWLPANLDGRTVIDAALIQVWRLPDTGAGDGNEELMSHIDCLQIRRVVGPDAGSAIFRYTFDDNNPDRSIPHSWDVAVNDEIDLPGKVRAEDRLVVTARSVRPDDKGEYRLVPIFDGNVRVFRAKVEGEATEAQFVAMGRARKLWATPIGGAIFRDGFEPRIGESDGSGFDVPTRRVAHFNRAGKANRSPAPINIDDPEIDYPPINDIGSYNDWFSGIDRPGDHRYPVFMDENSHWPDVGGEADERNPRLWSIDDSTRYLLETENSGAYVLNPDFTPLSQLLVSYEPIDEETEVDLSDPETYHSRRIITPDKPADGNDLPNKIHDLIAGKGFNYFFGLRNGHDEGLNPETYFDFFAVQNTPVRHLWLQPRGSKLDLTKTNTVRVDIVQDFSHSYNKVIVEGSHTRYQISAILGYGWPMQATDKNTPKDYSLANSEFTIRRNHYRLLILGEGGNKPYFTKHTTVPIYTIPMKAAKPIMDQVFGSAPEGGDALYVHRPRKVLPWLISLDTNKEKQKYQLLVSYDYTGDIPGIWDPHAPKGATPQDGGTWQPIAGGYEILPGCIGAFVTTDNPNGWHTGEDTDGGKGIIKLVDSLAVATPSSPVPIFRLDCVIEADDICEGIAERPDGAVLPEELIFKTDARDRLYLDIIKKNSAFNDTSVDVIYRDDRPKAIAEARSQQLGLSGGASTGPITLGHFTDYYMPGHRIGSINGVDVSLRADKGDDSLPAVLPMVVSVTWDFRDGQTTLLETSDATTARSGYRQSHRSHAGKKAHG